MITFRSFVTLGIVLGIAPLVGVLFGYTTKQDNVVTVSVASFVVGMALVLTIWLAGLLARTHQLLLATVFGPLLVITNVAVLVLTAVNGGVLTLAFGERAPGGAAITAIATLFGVAVMANRALTLPIARVGKGAATGVVATEEQEPRLWAMVRDVAKQVGTRPPANILLGLELNFYATEQPKELLGPVDERTMVEKLQGEDEEEAKARKRPVVKGRTVYLSMPLCKIMTVDELKAVLAHELAHFRGWDTKFTRIFYPMWRAALASFEQLGEAMSVSIFTLLPLMPAYSVLELFVFSFAEAEGRVSRDRELAADRSSLAATDDRTVASALVKLHGFSRYWRRTNALMREKIRNAEQDLNVVQLYAQAAEENKGSVWMRHDLDQEEPPHPTDTHPPLSRRLSQLKLTLKDVEESAFTVQPDAPATTLLDHGDALEALLTQAEKRRMIVNHEAIEGAAKKVW